MLISFTGSSAHARRSRNELCATYRATRKALNRGTELKFKDDRALKTKLSEMNCLLIFRDTPNVSVPSFEHYGVNVWKAQGTGGVFRRHDYKYGRSKKFCKNIDAFTVWHGENNENLRPKHYPPKAWVSPSRHVGYHTPNMSSNRSALSRKSRAE